MDYIVHGSQRVGNDWVTFTHSLTLLLLGWSVPRACNQWMLFYFFLKPWAVPFCFHHIYKYIYWYCVEPRIWRIPSSSPSCWLTAWTPQCQDTNPASWTLSKTAMVINPNPAFRSHHKAVVCEYGQRVRWLVDIIDSRDMSFEQTPGGSAGQGSLAWYRSWGRKELDTTGQMNSNSDPSLPAIVVTISALQTTSSLCVGSECYKYLIMPCLQMRKKRHKEVN